jgi:FkbM family methyltransferase
MSIVHSGSSVIYDPYINMHDPVEAKIEWLTQNGYMVRGVIHIGANDGKELSWYVTKNYRPILAFEPHPEAFKQLYEHYWNHAQLWQLALGRETGKIRMNIPEDGDTEKSSKYMPIPTENHGWTNVPITDSVEVIVTRFDTWVGKTGIDLSPFNTVVIDVQGMELEVLQGFGVYINSLEHFIVECSRVPVYDGEPPAQEVIDWMENNRFAPLTPIEDHDDIIFRRV